MASGLSVPQGRPLNIVMMGKTGCGKSATGNTLLCDDNKFKSEMSPEAVTIDCTMKNANIGGRELWVVDTPGTMDTRDPDAALKEIAKAIQFRPDGFDAFLIVLKIGARMTKEEQEAVLQLQRLFGERLMNFTVLIFTHGDNFDAEMRRKKQNIPFLQYIKSKENDFLIHLLRQCNDRCVVVNNLSASPERESVKIIRAVHSLTLQNRGLRYTNRYFQEAQRLGPIPPDLLMLAILNMMKENDEECFPASSTVRLQNGSVVKMEDLEPGSLVLSSSGKSVSFSEVYLFGHRLAKEMSSFVLLKTASHEVKMTPGHHVHIQQDGVLKTEPARNIAVGDQLLTISDGEGLFTEEAVVSVSYTEEEGLYAPFTMNGSIVVDGVLATCYVDIVPPSVAHSLLWPVRQLYKMSPATLATISKTGDDGIPCWIRWCLDNVVSHRI